VKNILIKAYKFKIKRPSKRIAHQFEQTLDVCRELYNSALRERIDAYRITGKSVNYQEQQNQLPDIKLLREDVAAIHSQVVQDPLRRVNRAFEAFFQRCLKGDRKAGFPRFKHPSRYHSFTYPQAGFKLEGNKLRLSKIGSVRLRLSRPIEGRIKTCSIKRQVDGWFVIFTVEENQARWMPKTGDSIGLDVGLENFATLSTGEPPIDNPRYLRKAERALKIQQRKVSKKKLRGSNRRKAVVLLGKKHLKIQNQRKDFFHKTSLDLIRKFDEIAVEDLNIKGLLKNHHLAKSISDAAWGTFISVLENKAANAGRRVWKVQAAFTSQDCSQCGDRVKKSLSQREHRCIGCGYVAHRDHNAALNIAAKGWAQSVADSGVLSVRDPFVRVNVVTQ
jgi:putative transposase